MRINWYGALGLSLCSASAAASVFAAYKAWDLISLMGAVL